MKKPVLHGQLRAILIAGNLLYVLWIVYNAIDAGFSARPVEVAASCGLLVLLFMNSIFLLRKTDDTK
jgi:hypothetical protein